MLFTFIYKRFLVFVTFVFTPFFVISSPFSEDDWDYPRERQIFEDNISQIYLRKNMDYMMVGIAPGKYVYDSDQEKWAYEPIDSEPNNSKLISKKSSLKTPSPKRDSL